MKIMLAVSISLFISCASPSQENEEVSPSLDVAQWLTSLGQDKETGRIWPKTPQQPDTFSLDLYSGNLGIILFFLELYYFTEDAAHLEQGLKGADYVLSHLPDKLSDAGLYTGIAGAAFTLEQAYKASKKKKYRDGALKCIQLMGDGTAWGDCTDVISGAAGSGLFLLWAHKEMGQALCLDLAKKTGLGLIKLGEPAAGGLRWKMDPNFPRIMPNFSHGTAGICYFLVKLYEATEHQPFLDHGIKGAEHLIKITNEQGLIHHHEPGGEELYYLGWCHGPTGTGRLYYALWKATGEEKWRSALKKSAQGLLQSGIPEKRTPGFWNNESICCGTAGVAGFALNLYQVFGDKAYLDFAKRLYDCILSNGVQGKDGMRWVQAEHRKKPKFLQEQTGYMQGASGIGLSLLHMEYHLENKKPRIILPDSPF